MFLTRFSEPIESCFWLNLNYLILKIKNSIKIVETDTRDRINIYDLNLQLENQKVSFEKSEIFFNSLYKRLYIKYNKNLYYSEVLF
jgi:hypothetical protein